MAFSNTKDRSTFQRDYSYQGVTKVLIAAISDQAADRVPREMWNFYTAGDNPKVIIGGNNEPPRVRKDIFLAAREAVEKNTAGAPGAREMLQKLNELHKGQLTPQAERDAILNVLTAKGNAKPLAAELFNDVRHLLDRDAGGLSKEGWDRYKGDPEIVAAAKTQRTEWAKDPGTKTAEKAADKEVGDKVIANTKDVLALLTAKPGEHTLDRNTYRKLVGTADRPAIVDMHSRGGLTQGAYNAFKSAADQGNELAKQVLGAAETHRKSFVRPQKPEITAENKELVTAMLNRRSSEERPLTDVQFAQVNRLFNRATGTLTIEAEKQAKDQGMTDVLEANEARKQFSVERMAEKQAATKAAAPAEKAQEPAALTR